MTNGSGARRSLLAVASLTSALIVFFPPAWIAAIILGVVALVEIKQSSGALRGRGLAVTGIVLSLVWTVLLVVFLIVSLAGTRQGTADLFPPTEEEPLSSYDENEAPAAVAPEATPATPTAAPATPTANQTMPPAQQ